MIQTNCSRSFASLGFVARKVADNTFRKEELKEAMCVKKAETGDLFYLSLDLLQLQQRLYRGKPVDIDIIKQPPDFIKCLGMGVED